MVTDAIALLATSNFTLSGATRIMMASSLMERIIPRMPPAVVIRSPFFIAPSISCHCFCRFCCGRIITRYSTGINSKGRSIVRLLPEPPAGPETGPNNAKLVTKFIPALILCPSLAAITPAGSGHRRTRPQPVTRSNLSPGIFLAAVRSGPHKGQTPGGRPRLPNAEIWIPAPRSKACP